MRTPSISMPLLTIIAALGLSACGGGGSAGVASIPPPPPPPPPPPSILFTGGVSQQFASAGATYPTPLGQIAGGATVPGPLLDDPSQLKLRYDASSDLYEIQLPNSQNWQAIAPVAGTSDHWATTGSAVTLTAINHTSAALLSWSGPNSFGVTAVGIPTQAADVPTAGTGTYTGGISGYSSEVIQGASNRAPGAIGGDISLVFDFGSGALTGSIQPTLTLTQSYGLPTLSFANTVHAVGSPSFSGTFQTSLSGSNSFAGSLAGPYANNFFYNYVFGNFAFPYQSPIDGSLQQAAGAFVGIDFSGRRLDP